MFSSNYSYGVFIAWVVVILLPFLVAIYLEGWAKIRRRWKISAFVLLMLWMLYWLFMGMLEYELRYFHYHRSLEEIHTLIALGKETAVLDALEKYRQRLENESESIAADALDYIELQPLEEAAQDDEQISSEQWKFAWVPGKVEYRACHSCFPFVDDVWYFAVYILFFTVLIIVECRDRRGVGVGLLVFLLLFSGFWMVFAGQKCISDSRVYRQVFQQIAVGIEKGQAQDLEPPLRRYLEEVPYGPVKHARIEALCEELEKIASPSTELEKPASP